MKREEYELAARRVRRVRKIYSRIGVPLSAEIIVEMHRALAGTQRWTKACRRRKFRRDSSGR